MGVVEKRFYSVSELQTVLGISRSTAYQLIHRLDFPSVRINDKRVIIPIADLDEWLEKQRREQKGIGA